MTTVLQRQRRTLNTLQMKVERLGVEKFQKFRTLNHSVNYGVTTFSRSSSFVAVPRRIVACLRLVKPSSDSTDVLQGVAVVQVVRSWDCSTM